MSSTHGIPHSGIAPGSATVASANPFGMLPFAEMASTLWRRRWLIIGVVIITSLIGAAVLTSLTPRYRSHAVIALDRASNHSATFDTPLTSLVVDGEAVASEIELIYSRELIEQVVVDQQLLDTKEYGRKDEAGQPGFPAQMLAGVRAQIKAAIQDLLPTDETTGTGTGTGTGAGAGAGTGTHDPIGNAVDQFSGNLDIQRKGISRAIVISFSAEDPNRAASVANALASRYIDDQQRLQREQEGVASEQLEAKLAQLREKLSGNEQAIEEQRRALGQVTADGSSKVEQRLAGLNNRLIDADAERAAARAELRQAQAMRNTPSAIDSIPAALASAAVGQLREREFDLQAELTQLSTKYGEKHPLVQQASNQLQQTRESLGLEIDKTIGALQSKVTIADSRMESVEREMARLESEELAANPAKASLVGLQRDAGSLRDRIAFLENRLSEVSQVNSLASLRPFARIISKAQVPDSASYPKKKLLLALIALLAALATVTVLLGKCLYRHQLRSRLPTLNGSSAVWMASFPQLTGRDRKSSVRQQLADKALINVQKALPADAANTVMVTTLDAPHDDDDGSVAWRLAKASTRRERRTLYVDLTSLDARHGSSDGSAGGRASGRSGSRSTGIHSQGALDNGSLVGVRGAAHGAVAALKGLAPINQAVKCHPGLPDSLSAEGLLADAAVLLSGERLQHCLEDWSSTYHTIIIDAPPVLDSPNAALINQSCSLGLLVSTLPVLMRRNDALERALQRLYSEAGNPTGIIVDALDESLFEAEHFDYASSEHYLARLTGKRLPATVPVSGDHREQAFADLQASHFDGQASHTLNYGVPMLDRLPAYKLTGRSTVSADRLSNVVSLRRNRQRRPPGTIPSPVYGEAWLLQQSPERFTIRLTKPRAPGDVGKSLTDLAEHLPLAWYSKSSSEQIIPVLIVGLFDSPAEVRAVLESTAMSSIADGAEACVIAQIQAEIVRHRRAEAERVTRSVAGDSTVG